MTIARGERERLPNRRSREQVGSVTASVAGLRLHMSCCCDAAKGAWMRPLAALLLLAPLVAGLFALGGQVGRWTDERMYAGAGAATLRDMREGQGRPGTSLLGDARPQDASAPHDLPSLPDRLIIDVRDQREHPATRYEVWAAIRDAFPPEEYVRAMLVAWCESRGDPLRVGRYGERGVMQIHPVHRPFAEALGYTWDSMLELGQNIAVAAALARRDGFGIWSCSSATW